MSHVSVRCLDTTNPAGGSSGISQSGRLPSGSYQTQTMPFASCTGSTLSDAFGGAVPYGVLRQLPSAPNPKP